MSGIYGVFIANAEIKYGTNNPFAVSNQPVETNR